MHQARGVADYLPAILHNVLIRKETELRKRQTESCAYGKVIGFLFGFITLGLMSYALPKTSWAFRFGTLFYHIVNGLLVCILSLDIQHPVFPMEFKWWITGPLFGGWMTFTLMLFIGDEYERILNVSQSFMRHFTALF